MLRSHGLALESGVLTKPPGVSECWNTAVLLQVADPSRFSVTVDMLDMAPGSAEPAANYIIGIALASSKLSVKDIESHARGVFLDCDLDEVTQSRGRVGKCVYPGAFPMAAGKRGLAAKGQVELTYMDAALYLAFAGQDRFKIVEDIPPGDYRPCISMEVPGQRLRVLVRTPGGKRPAGSRDQDAPEMAASLWVGREFTDAVVVCGQKRIPVHRCVLSAASPFFAAAFKGAMREATEAIVNVGEAAEDVVEGFLQYLYTKSIPDGLTCIDILPLAHRYDCKSLLHLCASTLQEEALEERNVVKYMMALQPFENDPVLGACWTRVAEQIGSDPRLAKAVMRGCCARRPG